MKPLQMAWEEIIWLRKKLEEYRIRAWMAESELLLIKKREREISADGNTEEANKVSASSSLPDVSSERGGKLHREQVGPLRSPPDAYL